ncbi:MAG: SRPBCC domain-containing protein [Kineosporiaceae bacterium]
MPIRDITKDLDALTMTAVCEFAAPATRVWQVWADPRQLERWWGPPDWPATFTSHEFAAGGRATYVMHGPDGDTAGGWWRFVAVEAPTRIEIEEGFADADGTPDESMPVTPFTVTFVEVDGVTTMTITWRFPDLATVEQFTAMGMDSGIRSALAQVDDVLAA